MQNPWLGLFTKRDISLVARFIPYDDEPGYLETYVDEGEIAELNDLIERIASVLHLDRNPDIGT